MITKTNMYEFWEEVFTVSKRPDQAILDDLGFYRQKLEWWINNPENFPLKYSLELERGGPEFRAAPFVTPLRSIC